MHSSLVWLAMQFSLLGNGLLPDDGTRPPDPPIIRCPGGYLQAIAFSSDGAWVAAAYFDLDQQRRTVGVWETRSLRPIFIDQEQAGYRGFEALAFTPDKKQLVALGDSHDRNEWVAWDTATGKRTLERDRPRERHDPNLLYGYQTRELLWAGNRQWLLHDAVAGLVTDLATGETVHDYDKKLVGHLKDIVGGVIIVTDSGGPRTVYDAATGKLLYTHPPIKNGIYTCCDFSQDGTTRCLCPWVGRFLVTKSSPPTKCIFRFDIKSKAPDGIHLSPDGRLLAISYQDFEVGKKVVPALFPDEYEYQQVFDTATGRPVGAPIAGMAVYFAPNGDRMAVVSREDHIAIIAVPASKH